MAYGKTYGKEDALKTMESIIGDKQGWTIAGNVKHEINGMNAQDYYAQNAQKKYNELIANGYGTAANNLKNSNLEQAKKYINNFYVKTGRNQFKPYMYEKGKQYGLTNADIDKLTSFDSETGEVIFGGKNIGRPDGIADDRSYFTSEYLDDVWDNYVKESGITVPKEKLADQTLQNATKYIDELSGQQVGNRDYIMNTGTEQRQRKDDFIKSQQNADIMNTDTAKAIMDKFNYLGGVAGGSELASGAAANGGNIDSFSAANRARQQLAYTTAGTEAVIAEYQNRMNNVMDILKSIDSQNANEYGALAINHQSGLDTAKAYSDTAQQLYDAENKNFDKELADRESKGYFYDYSANPYLNSDGTVKNIDLDYTAIYNNAKKSGDEKTAKWASEAAYQKIQSKPELYGQYYDSNIHKLDPTDYRQDTATVGADKRQNETQIKITGIDAETEKFVAQLSSNTQITLQELVNEATKAGYTSNEVIAKIEADAAKYGIDADKYIADLDYKIKNGELDLTKYMHDNASGEAKLSAETEKFIAQLSSDTQITLQNMLNEVTKLGYDKDKFVAQLAADTEGKRIGLDKYIADLDYKIENGELDLTKYMHDNASGDKKLEVANGTSTGTSSGTSTGTSSGTSTGASSGTSTGASSGTSTGASSGTSTGTSSGTSTGNSSGTTTETKTTPMSKSEVTKFVNGLTRKGNLLLMNGIGHYTPLKGGEKALVNAVLESDLTDEQANYFLKDIVGMSQSEIEKYMK